MSGMFPPHLVAFSEKLMTGTQVSDDEIVEVLGEAAVPAFRYAQNLLNGRVRKVGNEPVICHSADIAIRARDLGYSDDVVTAALLHDTVEDRSKTYAQMHKYLHSIRYRFGEVTFLDVMKLTNRACIVYPLLPAIIKSEEWTFDLHSVDAIAAAVREFGEKVKAEFPGHFDTVFYETDYFLTQREEVRNDPELHGKGDEYHKYDAEHSLLGYLTLKSYRLFLEEMVRDALERGENTESGLHETALVVKALDLVDNLRTHEVASYRSTARILTKTDMYLDYTFFLHAKMRREGRGGTFKLVYDYLKNHLYEQMLERRQALSHLEDTRFRFLAEFMDSKIATMRSTYKLPEDPKAELEKLRGMIRQANGV